MMDESGDANDYMEYSFTVVDGQTYKITFAARRGTQGTTQEVSGWEGFTTDPTIDIPSTSWATHEVILLANSTSAKIKVHSALGGAAGDKVHFDNFSIRAVQGGDIKLYGLLTGGGTDGLRVLGNGFVGIGTTSPLVNLHIKNPAPIIRLDASTTGSDWQIEANNQVADKLIIRDVTNAINIMTFDQTGNVGIGTTTPDKLLHLGDNTNNINGTIRFEAEDGDLIDMGITTDDDLYITGGDVGIGLLNPSSILHINGNFTLTGNGNTCTLYVDINDVCDVGTEIGEDNSIAICLVCA